MGWLDKMRNQAQQTIRENDSPLIREVAWAIILRTWPAGEDICTCYANDGTIAGPGVDLTQADENGNLWMSWQTAEDGYPVDPGKTGQLVQLLQGAAAAQGITWSIPIYDGLALLNAPEDYPSTDEIYALCLAFAPHLL